MSVREHRRTRVGFLRRREEGRRGKKSYTTKKKEKKRPPQPQKNTNATKGRLKVASRGRIVNK